MERTTRKFSPPFFVLVSGLGLGFISIIATDRITQLGFGIAGIAATLASLYLLVAPKGAVRILALITGIGAVLGMGIISAIVISGGSATSAFNSVVHGSLAVSALSMAAYAATAFIADSKSAREPATAE